MCCRPVKPTCACSLLLCTVSLLFTCGSVLLLLAVWYYTGHQVYQPLLQHQFFPLTIIIFTATLAVVCAVCVLIGSLAVLLQRPWLAMVLAISLGFCAFAASGCSITALFFHEQIRPILNESLNMTMTELYGQKGSEDVTRSVDLMQRTLQCCGYTAFTDWQRSQHYQNSSLTNGTAVPSSCCQEKFLLDVMPRCNEGFPLPDAPNKLHQKGCLPLLESWYRQISYQIGLAAGITAAVLFLIVCISMFHFGRLSAAKKEMQAVNRYYSRLES